jgi:hypothetical protein
MATKANLVIEQGATFSADLNLTDDNGDALQLSGYTANSLMKKWYTSSKSVTFGTSIDVNTGIITLSLNANNTANLNPGRYVYDVDITDTSGTVSRVVEGIITVTPSVSAVTYAALPTTANSFPNSAPLT